MNQKSKRDLSQRPRVDFDGTMAEVIEVHDARAKQMRASVTLQESTPDKDEPRGEQQGPQTA